jgi:peptidoglycan/LPS O-acetylase OafA/YrhL
MAQEPPEKDLAPAVKGRVHFPGLNELRFIAWFAVFLGHVEQWKDFYHYPHRYWIQGRLGVVLFFVISGFLITYLLLSEKLSLGSISIKDFYVRRILRIWPLYFLVILSCMLVVSRVGPLAAPAYQDYIDRHFWPIFLGYAVFVPTLVEPVLFTTHVWSIAVEEQFYIVWPWFVKWSHGLWLLVLVPIVAIFAPTIIWEYPTNWRSSITIFHAWEYARHFSCLAIGCLTAICYLGAPRVLLRCLYHPAVQASVLGCLIALLWIAHSHGEEGVRAEFGADARWYSLLFGIVILNVATNPRPLVRFENRVADYLGRISYGLYMFHPIAIALAVYALRPLIRDNYESWLSNAAVYILSFVLSVFVASTSYHFFEQPFLRLKSRFARVPSG